MLGGKVERVMGFSSHSMLTGEVRRREEAEEACFVDVKVTDKDLQMAVDEVVLKGEDVWECVPIPENYQDAYNEWLDLLHLRLGLPRRQLEG